MSKPLIRPFATIVAAFVGMTVLGMGTASRAALIADFQMNDGTAGAGVTTETNDAASTPGVTISSLTADSNWTKDNDQPELVTGSFDNELWYKGATSIPNAVDPAFNLTFTITPAAGTTVTLDAITAHMGVRRDESELSGRVNANWKLRVNQIVDGVTTLIGTLTSPTSAGEATTAYGTPSLTFATGAISAPITIRMDYYDTTSQGDKRYMLDDLEVTATVSAVAVPEPTFASLASLAALGLVRRRTRR